VSSNVVLNFSRNQITLDFVPDRVVIAGVSGPTGPANTLTIGTVTTVAAGGSATASVGGTAPNQTLSLGIPTGATGATGATGTNGTNGDWSTAQTLNAQTGTSYTLVAGDVGKLVTLENGAAVALTVPSGLGLTAGQRIDLAQLGAGQVTVTGSSATVNSTPTAKLRTQYSAATLICTASNVYLLVGDLAVS